MSHRIGTFALLLIAAWCVMTFTHEAGHIVGGWCCGGTLQQADLWPWHLPYSLFDPDPYPLITLWCGPLLGVVVPMLIAWISGRREVWLIAHFCLLSNGLYLPTAWFTGDRFLDTAQLLEHGAHPAAIAIYCLATISVGYVGFRRECLAWFRREDHAPRS